MSRRAMVLRHVGLCLAMAVVAMIGIVAVGWTPRVELFVALALAVAVASVALVLLGNSLVPAVWALRKPTVDSAAGADGRVTFLEHSLRRSGEDDTAFALRVRPVLVGVSTHRLRRAGVDIETEPDAARALLGDDVWDVLTGPAHRPIPRRRLERAIERIEQL